MRKRKLKKSYGATKKDGTKSKTPWDEDQDPQGWMWIKTVLKQLAKLVPKNDRIIQAIAEDNKDSILADRLEGAKELIPSLQLGAVLKTDNEHANAQEAENQETGEQPAAAGEDSAS